MTFKYKDNKRFDTLPVLQTFNNILHHIHYEEDNRKVTNVQYATEQYMNEVHISCMKEHTKLLNV